MGASIEQKAWKVFSEYIRMRDSTDILLAECYTCGACHFYVDMDCGHYIDRRYKSVMFDEMNNHAQCHKCNRQKDGDKKMLARYREKLVRQYTEEAVQMLEERAKEMEKPDYREIYETYKLRVDHYKRGRFRKIFYPDSVEPRKFKNGLYDGTHRIVRWGRMMPPIKKMPWDEEE